MTTTESPLAKYGVADLFPDYSPEEQQVLADSIADEIAGAPQVHGDWLVDKVVAETGCDEPLVRKVLDAWNRLFGHDDTVDFTTDEAAGEQG